MAKVNTPQKEKSRPNKAGGASYQMPIKERLASRVLGSFFGEPAYYGDCTPDMINEANEVGKKNPEFLAKLAVFARETMFLRTTPTVLIGILGLHGKKYVRPAMRRVILRPDQVTELMAWCNQQKTPNLNQVKLGVADALNRFDSYQFGKYKGGGGKIHLRDALIWSHPKPVDKLHEGLFKDMIDGTLGSPRTWETVISEKGNNAEAWEGLIESDRLPYMATLRNLRNMLKAGISEVHMQTVCTMISNPHRVAKSKQFPYRFLAAQQQLTEQDSPLTGMCLEAIGQAADFSVENVPKLEGVTFITADNSGSMYSPISAKSKIMRSDVANLMQAIFKAQNDRAITSVFGARFEIVNVRPGAGVLENCERFKNTNVGHATYAHLAIKYLLDKQLRVDRIIILTDEQIWDRENIWDLGASSSFKRNLDQYRRKINPGCWLHIMNLAGYGDAVMPAGTQKISRINGWTDRIFEFMGYAEGGLGSMVKQIESIKL